MPCTSKYRVVILITQYNPFPPSVPIWHRLAKFFILILDGIVKKNFYERRDYESVDEKSLSWAMSRKNDGKKNSGGKGLEKMRICKFA